MYRDILSLQEFYDSPLGDITQRLILRTIQDIWPSLSGESLLGLGYTCPYLNAYMDTSPTFSFMPAQQGVIHWPIDAPSLTALVHEDNLPLAHESVDRILLVHQLEFSTAVSLFLRELWRVLAPYGRILLVVPNRRGLWARFDNTPFGYGQPYSRNQLTRLLQNSLFTPVRVVKTLYIPPVKSRTLLGLSPLCESLGCRVFPKFSGVLMVEAIKQVYAAPPLSEKIMTHAPHWARI